ncbi:unnamed protein product [Closterium sp. NIES-53]
MASLRVLAFDHEGRPIQFDTWLDDLQLYLQSDSRDSVSLFDHTSWAALAPPATPDSATRSQWLTRDAAARLAICNHLPLAECAHFEQHRTAQALYDTVVSCYSSPATVALGRLLLPCLFPKLSAFTTVEDLFLVTRLPDSLRVVGDHFLALHPTALTVDLLKQHLLAAETSVVAVGAARGTPHTPFFDGCSPSPLAPSYASAAAVHILGAEDVRGAFASGKCRSSKGKGGRGGGGGSGDGDGGSSGGGGGGGGGGSDGSGGGSGGFGGGGGGSDGGRGSGGSGSGGSRTGATPRGGSDDFDAIFAAMYALSASAEGNCYLCVPPDPGIAAAALGASDSALPCTAPAEALHTFTLDSSASRCFFRERTTLTPLSSPVPVKLADPSEGPVLTRSSTVLPCPAGWKNRTRGCLPTYYLLFCPARGHGRERYFLLVVDDFTRYTTVFPLRSKGQVGDVLIPWIRTVRLQLRDRFRTDLPVLRLHSDRGGEFSSDLLQDFCRGEGIFQSFTLPDSPQQNGIAERRIGLVMEPHVSLLETSPTLRWTGKVGDASVFRVWGSRAFVCDTSADNLSACAIPCVFLGFSPDAPGWQFYHPTTRRVFPSQDVTFDEAGPAPSGVSHVDPLLGTAPVVVAVGLGAALGAASGGAEPRGSEPGGAEPGGTGSEGAGSGGAEPEGADSEGAASGGAEPGGAGDVGVEPGVIASEGAESGGAELKGTASAGGPAGAPPRLSPWPEPLSPQQLRECFAQRTHLQSGAAGAGDSSDGDTGARGAGITARAGGTGAVAPAGPGGARIGGTGAAVSGGVGGAGAGDPTGPVAVGAGTGGTGARESQPPLQPASPLPIPSPYTEQTSGRTERREPASHPASPVCTGHRVPRLRPPPVPSTHPMAHCPFSIPLRVPLPAPLESSLPKVLDPESDCAHAASPTVSHLLATAVTDPSFESTAAFALVAELVEFAAACHLDYATALLAESESASPPSVGGECALGTDILEDRQEDFEGDYRSLLLSVAGSHGCRDGIVDGMWIFRWVISCKYSEQEALALEALELEELELEALALEALDLEELERLTLELGCWRHYAAATVLCSPASAGSCYGGNGGGGGGGTSGGSGGSGGGGGGSGGSGGSGGGGTGGGRTGPRHGGPGGGQRQQQQRRSETQSPQQLREWSFQRGTSSVAIFDLDFDFILSAMYALSASVEGECSQCVPPDPSIAAAALGALEFGTLPGTPPAEALHTFTLDSVVLHCFFCDSTTLTPLPAPVPVRLADPSGGPVVARSSTILPCLAVPSVSLSGAHGQGVTWPRSLVGQGQVCTHSLPSLLRLSSSTTALVTLLCHAFVACTLASLCLVSPSLCLPSHPRLLHPAFLASRGGSAPLLTPPRFPRRLLPCRLSTWTFRLHLCERLSTDLPVLRLHSNRGGEFSSDLLRDFCRGEGITQSFMLPDSPQQNGIAERRIGLVMEVDHTSMIHAAAPHFLWPFAARYAAHQLNLWPRVSLPETSPTLRWTGKVGDASVFRAWDSLLPPYLASCPPLSGRHVLTNATPGTVPGKAVVDSGAARGTASGGAEPGGAGPGGAEPRGAKTGGAEPRSAETGAAELRSAETGGAEPGGAETRGAEPEGVEPGGAVSEGAESGGVAPRGAASSGATGAGGTGAAGARGAGLTARDGVPGGTAATGHGGARTRGTGAAGTSGVGGAGAGDPTESGAAGAGGSDAGGAGDGGGGVGGTGAGGAGAGGAGAVDPGGTVPDPESDLARAASPTVSRLLATVVTDPFFESATASALVAKLLDFAAACRVDYFTALLTDSASASPPSVGDEYALGTDVLEDRQEDFECLRAAVPRFVSMLFSPEGDPDAPDIPSPRSYAEAIMGPYSSRWQEAMDAKMASWKSTGTYVDEVPPPGVNIVDGMWIFRVKRPPGSPPAFKARYVARDFSQRQGVDYFQTFSPTPKMTTL